MTPLSHRRPAEDLAPAPAGQLPVARRQDPVDDDVAHPVGEAVRLAVRAALEPLVIEDRQIGFRSISTLPRSVSFIVCQAGRSACAPPRLRRGRALPLPCGASSGAGHAVPRLRSAIADALNVSSLSVSRFTTRAYHRQYGCFGPARTASHKEHWADPAGGRSESRAGASRAHAADRSQRTAARRARRSAISAGSATGTAARSDRVYSWRGVP